eukprot:CFRG6565T1
MSCETLSLQLEEALVLQSVYGDEDFYCDENTLEVIREFVSSATDIAVKVPHTLPMLFFDIKLLLPGHSKKDSISIRFDLPHEYPNVPSRVSVSSPFLPREIHAFLQGKVQEFVSIGSVCSEDRTLGVFDICCHIAEILPLVSEMAERETATQNSQQPMPISTGSENEVYFRQWILFHHVYSKSKRRDIVSWANDLDLKGFLKSGKPGVVCVEGRESMVRELLIRIGRLNWQQMTRKGCESIKMNNDSDGLMAQFCEDGFVELKERDCGPVLIWLRTKNLASEFMVTLGLSCP